MDGPPRRPRKRKRGHAKIGRGGKGNRSKRHRAGALISPSRPRRGSDGPPTDHGSEREGGSSTGLEGGKSVGKYTETASLRRRLSYAKKKAGMNADEVVSLRKEKRKLEKAFREEEEAGKAEEERHERVVSSLSSDLTAAKQRLKERTSRFEESKLKLREKLSRSAEEVKALKNEQEIIVANADRAQTVAVAVAIKEGEDKIEQCRKDHLVEWEQREASLFSCLYFLH